MQSEIEGELGRLHMQACAILGGSTDQARTGPYFCSLGKSVTHSSQFWQVYLAKLLSDHFPLQYRFDRHETTKILG